MVNELTQINNANMIVINDEFEHAFFNNDNIIPSKRHHQQQTGQKGFDSINGQDFASRHKESIHFIQLIGNILRASCINTPNPTNASKDFYCPMRVKPSISIEHYLERLAVGINHAYRERLDMNSTGIRTMVMALVYLDRLMKLSNFVPDDLNIHRVIFIGMTVATKILQDEHNSASAIARIGGVPTIELNDLEIKFCNHMKFTFEVSNQKLLETFRAILKTSSANTTIIPSQPTTTTTTTIPMTPSNKNKSAFSNCSSEQKDQTMDTDVGAAAA